MRKSTQAISLVLIGSTSLFFYGCESRQACNQVGPDGQPRKDCSGSTVHGARAGSYMRPGSSTVGSDPSTGTRTGGFGTHGSGISGSSAT